LAAEPDRCEYLMGQLVQPLPGISEIAALQGGVQPPGESEQLPRTELDKIADAANPARPGRPGLNSGSGHVAGMK